MRFLTMRCMHYLLIFFLLLFIPLFQWDQVCDTNWLAYYENSFVVKTKYDDLCTRTYTFLWRGSTPAPSLANRVRCDFQIKNSLSVLYSSFQYTTPFWKPPPPLADS